MYDNLQRLGPPPFDDADRAAAAKFQATLSDVDIEAAYRRVGVPVQNGVSLCDQVVPLDAKSAPMMGSTDVGDVSWVVPTVQARGATYAIGTPGHSWQLTAQGKLPAAHKGLVHVAKVMSGTAIDVTATRCCLRAQRRITRRASGAIPMCARCLTIWSRRCRCRLRLLVAMPRSVGLGMVTALLCSSADVRYPWPLPLCTVSAPWKYGEVQRVGRRGDGAV